MVISVDADLQDPSELIPELLARWEGGFNVVFEPSLEDRLMENHLRNRYEEIGAPQSFRLPRAG